MENDIDRLSFLKGSAGLLATLAASSPLIETPHTVKRAAIAYNMHLHGAGRGQADLSRKRILKERL